MVDVSHFALLQQRGEGHMADRKKQVVAGFAALATSAAVSAAGVLPFQALENALKPVNIYPSLLDGSNINNSNAKADARQKQVLLTSLRKRYDQCVQGGQMRPEYVKAGGCVFAGGLVVNSPNLNSGDDTVVLQALARLDAAGGGEVLVRQRVLGIKHVVPDPANPKSLGKVEFISGPAQRLVADGSHFKIDHYTGMANFHITYAFALDAAGKTTALDPRKVDLAPYGYQCVEDVTNASYPPDAKPRFNGFAPIFQPPGAGEATKDPTLLKKAKPDPKLGC